MWYLFTLSLCLNTMAGLVHPILRHACLVFQDRQNHTPSQQVLYEGGTEAAAEAPFIYAALDALALRARRWAARRAEALHEHLPGTAGAVAGGSNSTTSSTPWEDVGMAAEAQTKQVRRRHLSCVCVSGLP